jgi:cephalosporin-C deacetylase
MDINVHGQDVNWKEYPSIPGNNSDPKFAPVSDYYYNVHLRCLQAVNYLLSRPDVDPSRIVVVGGSQGGRLSVVVAGLDPRIAAAVPAIAHCANQPYGAWSHGRVSDGMELTGAPPVPNDPAGRCAAYYDPMNYAPDIHCPVLMNGGLIDPISPPYGVWAVYNRLGSTDKSIVAHDGHGHDWSAEFDRRAWKWLNSVLKKNANHE